MLSALRFLLLCFCWLPISAFAQGEPSTEEIQALLSQANAPLRLERALSLSKALLNRPYVLGPAGEGEYGIYDKKPLTRFDQFDCTTYVEAVLALASVPPGTESVRDVFFDHLKSIKYSDSSDVRFPNRNHFVETDWTPNAEIKGYLADLTQGFGVKVREQIKWLNIGAWYGERVKQLELGSDTNREAKLWELTQAGSSNSGLDSAGKKLGSVYYLTLDSLLSKGVRAKLLQERITVFNLVKGHRKGFDVPTSVGHQGFIVAKDGRLWVRHASLNKTTLDVLFESYIRERMRDSTWPTLGMQILRVLEP